MASERPKFPSSRTPYPPASKIFPEALEMVSSMLFLSIIWIEVYGLVSFKGSVTVSCLVVHDEFALNKVEAVWDCFKRTLYHFFFQLRAEIWELIHCFQRILGVRHSERNFKLIRFYQMTFEVVLLQHNKLFHRLVSYSKLQRCSNRWKLKELRTKMILNISSWICRFFSNFCCRFFNFEQDMISLCVSDPETHELNVVDVVFWPAKIVFCGFF